MNGQKKENWFLSGEWSRIGSDMRQVVDWQLLICSIFTSIVKHVATNFTTVLSFFGKFANGSCSRRYFSLSISSSTVLLAMNSLTAEIRRMDYASVTKCRHFSRCF